MGLGSFTQRHREEHSDAAIQGHLPDTTPSLAKAKPAFSDYRAFSVAVPMLTTGYWPPGFSAGQLGCGIVRYASRNAADQRSRSILK